MATFKKITNNEMFEKISSMHDDILVIKQETKTTNGNVRLHRKWLYALSSIFCSAVVFVVGWMLRG